MGKTRNFKSFDSRVWETSPLNKGEDKKKKETPEEKWERQKKLGLNQLGYPSRKKWEK